MSERDDRLRVYDSIAEYCDACNVPMENLLDILGDQKVLPMIRGKATEYVGAIALRQTLGSREWSVEKLNLNPQSGGSGRPDEDISITSRRTGRRLRTETKNAVRGSFKTGTRNIPQPHFAVKCHRSRSHLTRERNDRYMADDFDLLLCNASNAIFKGRHIGPGLPLIDDAEAMEWLRAFYGVATDAQMRRAAYDDWRFCLPADIAQDGIVPRTPKVMMEGDRHWRKLESLPEVLPAIIHDLEH